MKLSPKNFCHNRQLQSLNLLLYFIEDVMPHRFYYLRGAFGEAGLLDTHQEAIERVLYQGYTSKNIEKLQGYDVYSIRLGDVARLLFTTISYGEEDYLLALDYLPNHEYEKSKFLKYRVLERYREQATQFFASIPMFFQNA